MSGESSLAGKHASDFETSLMVDIEMCTLFDRIRAKERLIEREGIELKELYRRFHKLNPNRADHIINRTISGTMPKQGDILEKRIEMKNNSECIICENELNNSESSTCGRCSSENLIGGFKSMQTFMRLENSSIPIISPELKNSLTISELSLDTLPIKPDKSEKSPSLTFSHNPLDLKTSRSVKTKKDQEPKIVGEIIQEGSSLLLIAGPAILGGKLKFKKFIELVPILFTPSCRVSISEIEAILNNDEFALVKAFPGTKPMLEKIFQFETSTKIYKVLVDLVHQVIRASVATDAHSNPQEQLYWRLLFKSCFVSLFSFLGIEFLIPYGYKQPSNNLLMSNKSKSPVPACNKHLASNPVSPVLSPHQYSSPANIKKQKIRFNSNFSNSNPSAPPPRPSTAPPPSLANHPCFAANCVDGRNVVAPQFPAIVLERLACALNDAQRTGLARLFVQPSGEFVSKSTKITKLIASQKFAGDVLVHLAHLSRIPPSSQYPMIEKVKALKRNNSCASNHTLNNAVGSIFFAVIRHLLAGGSCNNAAARDALQSFFRVSPSDSLLFIGSLAAQLLAGGVSSIVDLSDVTLCCADPSCQNTSPCNRCQTVFVPPSCIPSTNPPSVPVVICGKKGGHVLIKMTKEELAELDYSEQEATLIAELRKYHPAFENFYLLRPVDLMQMLNVLQGRGLHFLTMSGLEKFIKMQNILVQHKRPASQQPLRKAKPKKKRKIE